MKRNNIIYIVVGIMGSGKTTTTKKIIVDYVKKFKKNVLIFDINNEYTNVSKIDPDRIDELYNFNNLSREIRIGRVVPDLNYDLTSKTDPVEEMAIKCIKNFKNGLLVFEDISQYMSDVKKKKIYSGLVSLRHRGVDMIFIFHSLADVPRKIRTTASVYRIHFTFDNIANYKDRFYNFPIIAISHYIVSKKYNDGNQYYHIIVDTIRNKIIGDYTDKQFVEGCVYAYNIIKPKIELKQFVKDYLRYKEN